jgi:hypothetical protein
LGLEYLVTYRADFARSPWFGGRAKRTHRRDRSRKRIDDVPQASGLGPRFAFGGDADNAHLCGSSGSIRTSGDPVPW